MRSVFLVDNGSLRPASTLNLRRIAATLSEHTGIPVEAASLLHSNKVPAEDLEGTPATTLGPRRDKARATGKSRDRDAALFLRPQPRADRLPA